MAVQYETQEQFLESLTRQLDGGVPQGGVSGLPTGFGGSAGTDIGNAGTDLGSMDDLKARDAAEAEEAKSELTKVKQEIEALEGRLKELHLKKSELIRRITGRI